MKLLTKAIETQLSKHPLYSTEKDNVADVIVKFFAPWSNWTWYALEGTYNAEENDWMFFGLVEGQEKELGYFRLSELASVRGRFGLGIERDMYFEGHKVNKETMEVI